MFSRIMIIIIDHSMVLYNIIYIFNDTTCVMYMIIIIYIHNIVVSLCYTLYQRNINITMYLYNYISIVSVTIHERWARRLFSFRFVRTDNYIPTIRVPIYNTYLKSLLLIARVKREWFSFIEYTEVSLLLCG